MIVRPEIEKVKMTSESIVLENLVIENQYFDFLCISVSPVKGLGN